MLRDVLPYPVEEALTKCDRALRYVLQMKEVMLLNEQTLYDVWWKHPEEGDQGMEEDHIPHWKRVLGFIPEENLEQCSVLDFGCNQEDFSSFV